MRLNTLIIGVVTSRRLIAYFYMQLSSLGVSPSRGYIHCAYLRKLLQHQISEQGRRVSRTYLAHICNTFVLRGSRSGRGLTFYDSDRLLIYCVNQTDEAVKLYTQDLGIMIDLDTYT